MRTVNISIKLMVATSSMIYHFCMFYLFGIIDRGRRGCDRLVVGFTTTYAICAYYH